MQASFDRGCAAPSTFPNQVGLIERSGALTPTIHSRSTSADSTALSGADDVCLRTTSYKSQATLSQLPDYDYPTPLIVKNTFIDTPIVRPLSLDEFLPDRRIQSCPVDPPATFTSQAETDTLASAQLLRVVTESAAALTTAASDAVRGWWNPVDSSAVPAVAPVLGATTLTPSATIDRPAPQVLLLADAIAEPVLGSQEFPTVGSAEHWVGTCRPCAFFHKSGCQNGVQCTFCHLCDAGEKRRRQKDKIAQMRQMRRDPVR